MKSDNMGQIRLAILGGALNSAVGMAHYSAIRMINSYDIVAGCFSKNAQLNRETGDLYNVAPDRVYENLNELLDEEKGKIDAVVILTPTNQHTQQVIDCIQAGVAVICEKSLTYTSAEAKIIKQELEKNKGFLTVIYNYLGYPMLRELKNIIALGSLGKVNHIQVEMPQEGFKRIGSDGKPVIPQEWRLHDGLVPIISLDLGVHLHIIIKFVTGQVPVNVVAASESYGNFPEVIDNVSGIIQYTNNLLCNMWYSKIAIGRRNGLNIRVYGELGSAEWVQENPEYLQMANNQGRRWTLDRGGNDIQIANQVRYTRFKAGHPAGFIEALANYYFDIEDAMRKFIKNEKNFMNSNCFGVNEALEGLQLFEAISKSSSLKSWQKIE